jgi:hypothetical protein
VNLVMLLPFISNYLRDGKELFVKSVMMLCCRINFTKDGKELVVKSVMLPVRLKFNRDVRLLYEKLLRCLLKSREVILDKLLLSNSNRFLQLNMSSFSRSGAVLFLMYCIFNGLKFNN